MAREITTPLLLTIGDSVTARFNLQYGVAASQWPGFCSDVPCEGFSQGYPRLDELPGVREWVGSRVVHDISVSAFMISNKRFESAVRIGRLDVIFDRLGLYGPVAAMLGGRAKQLPDLLAFGLLARGESLKGYDGLPFFGAHANYTSAGVASTYTNLQMPEGNDPVGPAWYLMDTSQPLMPLIRQEAIPFAMRSLTDLESERVFMFDEFVWGVDGFNNVGLGYFPLILKSYAPLTPYYYEKARTALMTQHRPDGSPYGIHPTKLYHPTSLKAAAKTLLKSALVNMTSNPWVDDSEPVESQWLS